MANQVIRLAEKQRKYNTFSFVATLKAQAFEEQPLSKPPQIVEIMYLQICKLHLTFA